MEENVHPTEYKDITGLNTIDKERAIGKDLAATQLGLETRKKQFDSRLFFPVPELKSSENFAK